jgi:GNAT superfamily N-acetyltransferase
MNPPSPMPRDARQQYRFTATEVHRISDGARSALRTHFLALPPGDRRLRFGASLSDAAVASYVDGIDFGRDAVFGIHDDALATVGLAHLAFGDGIAELGISVLPKLRGLGAGAALFARAASHARNRFVPTVFMHCLTENAAMMHIARKAGMQIVCESGDADAHLALSPASPASITGEYLTDQLAIFDYALTAHVATWKGINAALTAGRSAA